MAVKGVHFLVKNVAEGCAGAFYEEMAGKSDVFFKANPKQDKWIKKNWPSFIVAARAAMAKQLTITNLGEKAKEQIMEALIADSTIPGGSINRMQVH